MSVVIREIVPSWRVVEKINQKHGVTLDDVEHACAQKIKAVWDEGDPDRGRRLLVRGVTSNGNVLNVVLYPSPDDPQVFYLATAFRV